MYGIIKVDEDYIDGDHYDNMISGDPPLGFLKNLEDSCDRLSCSSCSCKSDGGDHATVWDNHPIPRSQVSAGTRSVHMILMY